MNKTDVVTKIHELTSLSKDDSKRAVDAMFDTIIGAVAEGDKVTIPGFGTFESRHRNARVGMNPQTGEKIQIPATDVPAFKAGKLFKEAVKTGEC